jgi:hypothetical protein
MSKLAVSVLIMGLVSTAVWGESRDLQSVDLDAVVSQYESSNCCWDKVDFERNPTQESDRQVGPECCWVPLWQENRIKTLGKADSRSACQPLL